MTRSISAAVVFVSTALTSLFFVAADQMIAASIAWFDTHPFAAKSMLILPMIACCLLAGWSHLRRAPADG